MTVMGAQRKRSDDLRKAQNLTPKRESSRSTVLGEALAVPMSRGCIRQRRLTERALQETLGADCSVATAHITSRRKSSSPVARSGPVCRRRANADTAGRRLARTRSRAGLAP